MEKPKEIIKLKITDISDMGQGIGRTDGIVVFVDGSLPGDLVRAEITEKKKKFFKAKALEILKSSTDRIQPKCPYSKECGGCGYMEMGYNTQLEIKAQHFKEKLERIAGVGDLDIEPIVGMDEPFFYRNKTEFTISKDGMVGFNRLNTNEVVDIPECCISSPVANAILGFLRSRSKNDLKNIRRVTVRTSFSTGETMVILETNITDIDRYIALIEDMDDAVNDMDYTENDSPAFSLESVYLYDPTKKKDLYKLAAGKRTIDDEMMGLKFEISPASFYQTNPIQTKNLFGKVKEYADLSGDERMIDLYCGVGSIGLSLADSAEEVLGVESVKAAVLDANRNAVINGIINARFITGKAEEIMDKLDLDENCIVLLDPPRAGCKPEVLEAIAGSKVNKIVYVSCDPGTFARDVKALESLGFFLNKVASVDMFPQTNHLEVVGLLSKK